MLRYDLKLIALKMDYASDPYAEHTDLSDVSTFEVHTVDDLIKLVGANAFLTSRAMMDAIVKNRDVIAAFRAKYDDNEDVPLPGRMYIASSDSRLGKIDLTEITNSSYLSTNVADSILNRKAMFLKETTLKEIKKSNPQLATRLADRKRSVEESKKKSAKRQKKKEEKQKLQRIEQAKKILAEANIPVK